MKGRGYTRTIATLLIAGLCLSMSVFFATLGVLAFYAMGDQFFLVLYEMAAVVFCLGGLGISWSAGRVPDEASSMNARAFTHPARSHPRQPGEHSIRRQDCDYCGTE